MGSNLMAVGSSARKTEEPKQLYTSVPSASANASSTSTPRYRTVLSIFVCPSKICTARKFPVCLYMMDALVRRSEWVP
jgi:hypothetical protein